MKQYLASMPTAPGSRFTTSGRVPAYAPSKPTVAKVTLAMAHAICALRWGPKPDTRRLDEAFARATSP